MAQRVLGVLVGLFLLSCVVAALAAAQTFEEALWGSPEERAAFGVDFLDDMGEAAAADPLCDEPIEDCEDELGEMMLLGGGVGVHVIQPCPPGATDPALCPRLKPPSYSQEAQLFALGWPDGGVYY